jgi:hypothetical protein
MSPASNTGAEPLVNCTDCGFAWFGATAAHGLSVMGFCPRCAGPLCFRGDAPAPDTGEHRTGPQLAPSRVLGRPSSWA